MRQSNAHQLSFFSEEQEARAVLEGKKRKDAKEFPSFFSSSVFFAFFSIFYFLFVLK
jgi:hypothetical protein